MKAYVHYDNISVNSSQNKKCFRQQLQGKPVSVLSSINYFSKNHTMFDIMWKKHKMNCYFSITTIVT